MSVIVRSFNVMHKVTVRDGAVETVLFVAASTPHEAKGLALEHLELGHRSDVTASAAPCAQYHVYKAYSVDLKTGQLT